MREELSASPTLGPCAIGGFTDSFLQRFLYGLCLPTFTEGGPLKAQLEQVRQWIFGSYAVPPTMHGPLFWQPHPYRNPWCHGRQF